MMMDENVEREQDTVIFTSEEQQLLLNQLKEDDQQRCICQSCMKEELAGAAYKFAKDKKKKYPKTWDKKEKADEEWRKNFLTVHNNEISKSFSFNCKKMCSLPSTSKQLSSSLSIQNITLPSFEVQNLDSLIDNMKKKFLALNKCSSTDKLHAPAKTIKLKIADKNRYKYKFKKSVLTFDEEIFLLNQLKKKTQRQCICQNCIKKELPIIAYRFVKNQNKLYPALWNRDKKAGKRWLEDFLTVHYHKILVSFPLHCKKESFLALTNEESASLSYDSQNVIKLSNNVKDVQQKSLDSSQISDIKE
ncbi:uncharacterized protein [Linepithema humile]|uniref:uncharacterized protein n=1 Tax=Linepithema humile TaxID=83485 RepID=UPI00351E682F